MSESNFEDIKDLLPELDKLVEQGWEPVLNLLSRGVWHVGLHHSTAPTPTIILTHNGPLYDSHRYRLHGHGATLRAALLQAIEQVEELTAERKR